MTESEQEARTERRAIMEVEQVPEADILALFKNRPDIYGILADESKQGDMFK